MYAVIEKRRLRGVQVTVCNEDGTVVTVQKFKKPAQAMAWLTEYYVIEGGY